MKKEYKEAVKHVEGKIKDQKPIVEFWEKELKHMGWCDPDFYGSCYDEAKVKLDTLIGLKISMEKYFKYLEHCEKED